MSPFSPGARGRAIEDIAARTLERDGLRIVRRNYLCRVGEIDLVMRDGATLVFVEVRYRRSDSHGAGAESVDRRKQRRIARAASHYLQRHHDGDEPPCRFDVVCVSGDPASPRIDWIPDAFQA